VSSEGMIVQGCDSVEIPSEVMGVEDSIHTCVSESRYLGYRRLKIQKVGIASSEVTSYDPLRS
jgi:hypothetical protein